MGLKDLIITPIFLLIFYALAYWLRPKFTDSNTRKYFIPALTVKFIGAISLGLIYQFYYGGGDTYNFTSRGSIHIWEAFLDSPINGIRLLFANGRHEGDLFQYSSKIVFFKDSSSYFVIKIAAFFGFFSFHTYSSIALFFATFSFGGLWALFSTFYKIKPEAYKSLAIVILFVPSVFFWGSGILKDTLTLGALGWLTYAVFQLFFMRKSILLNSVIMVLAGYIILSIKLYILLSFIPALILWIFNFRLSAIKSKFLKVLIAPLVIFIGLVVAYFGVDKVGEFDERYSIDQIAETARITAYDIRYYTGKNAGSGYDLGTLDGTFQSMILLAPKAINVSLFRPYIWEVSNILMVLSAFESLFILCLTVFTIWRKRASIFSAIKNPHVLFCLVFSITFAFAVGISTYNFGSLVRYKIPLIPFYLSALVLINYYTKKSNKRLSAD